MKLRNKKTGKVRTFDFVVISDDYRRDGELTKFSSPFHILVCRSIEQLNEEWENYEPAEPLIKDEKIRKAVRAWAEVNSIEKISYAARLYGSSCLLTDIGGGQWSIEFVGWIPTLKDDEEYTIAELCGDSEEDE